MRNLVLLTYDSLRADHCSHLGYPRETTPTLDRFANHGTSFEHAIAPASRTNPSMAGVFTGEPMVIRDTVANPVHARRHLTRHQPIAARLRDRGYATAAFCPNAYASRYYGFDRGFDHFEDFLFEKGMYQRLFDRHLSEASLFTAIRNARNLLRRQEAFKTWDTYLDDIVAWVNRQTDPFFLWVFSLDTHFPYLTPRRYREWSDVFRMYYYNWRCNRLIDALNVDLSEEERQHIINIYDDAISFADRFLAELSDRLRDYDPVFVVHGDHGEALTEHGVYGHFYPSLYDENIHVPLIVSDGTRSEATSQPVSLLEIPSILSAFCDTDTPSLDHVGDDWVTATDYDGRRNRRLTAVRTSSHKYLLSSQDSTEHRELYNLRADPSEQHNLVSQDPPVARPLRLLADRRANHEQELLEIRDSAERLTGNRSS